MATHILVNYNNFSSSLTLLTCSLILILKRILEFDDAVGMAVCNTFFKKEDSKLITYQSGDNRRMIDYLMVRKTDRCLVKDVKVSSSEECVPQHRNGYW